MVIVVVLASPAALFSLEREKAWGSDLTFWKETALAAPKSAIVQQHYGNALAAAGLHREAIEVFRDALPLLPDARSRASLNNNIGTALLDLERTAEAIQYFQSAVQDAPDYPVAHFNWALAELTLAKGETDQAMAANRRAKAPTCYCGPSPWILPISKRLYAGIEFSARL